MLAVLFTLSVILTTAVLFPNVTAGQIFAIMAGCAALSLAIATCPAMASVLVVVKIVELALAG